MPSDSRDAPDFGLSGLHALVTGASGGLGLHMAGALAHAGATVHLAARNANKLDSAVQALRAAGHQADSLALDVQDAAQVEYALQALHERIGASLDIVVNNAGVTNTRPLLAQKPDEWDRIMDTNLRGGWLVATAAARAMVAAQRGGAIVNVASILGERVAAGVGPYSASKAGLIQLTRTMALEWARYDIRCNALLPGYIATDLNREFLDSEAGERLRQRVPTRRFGTARDLDGPLLLLCSDAGRHITGAALPVDGGHLSSSL
ncbi:SDR family NAD(P)-dependent oxidoreductase [Paraburkholderia sp.]|uniref:SDR family NAD(P)-dependent oxidoreductase n=1 Tax=Paraburkholderia sp. TaxID=1926495 RepID=UPI002F413D09